MTFEVCVSSSQSLTKKNWNYWITNLSVYGWSLTFIQMVFKGFILLGNNHIWLWIVESALDRVWSSACNVGPHCRSLGRKDECKCQICTTVNHVMYYFSIHDCSPVRPSVWIPPLYDKRDPSELAHPRHAGKAQQPQHNPLHVTRHLCVPVVVVVSMRF